MRSWLKRVSSAMAKTKAMCIINRSTKLIGIQHEKKHGKGSKNSSAYFDSRIEIEQESDILIADYSFVSSYVILLNYQECRVA